MLHTVHRSTVYTILSNVHTATAGTCAYLIMSQDMIAQYIKFTLQRLCTRASLPSIPMIVNRAYETATTYTVERHNWVSNTPTKLEKYVYSAHGRRTQLEPKGERAELFFLLASVEHRLHKHPTFRT